MWYFSGIFIGIADVYNTHQLPTFNVYGSKAALHWIYTLLKRLTLQYMTLISIICLRGIWIPSCNMVLINHAIRNIAFAASATFGYKICAIWIGIIGMWMKTIIIKIISSTLPLCHVDFFYCCLKKNSQIFIAAPLHKYSWRWRQPRMRRKTQ